MFGKKWVVVALVVSAAVLLAAVAAVFVLPKFLSTEPSDEPTSEPSSSIADAFTPIMGDRVTFTATVLNVREDAVLVNANGALCWVRTTVQSDVPVPTMKVGDAIEIVHNGVVAESYPGQINFVYEIRSAQGEHPTLTYAFSPDVGQSKVLTQVVENCDLGCAVYYYGLDGMNVTVDGQTMSLQHALAVGVVSAEYWLSQAQRDATSGKCELLVYKDGGSKLYRYKDYAILKMNTIDGDKTLYIGTPDLTIEAVNKAQADDGEPLLKVTVSQNEQDKPTRVSTWRTAEETDYIIYYAGVDSVQVQTSDGYKDLIEAVHSEQIDVSTLRSELVDLARESDRQGAVEFHDGVLTDHTAYTETRIRFDDYAVTYTGYQGRREMFVCAPNAGGGLVQDIKSRIAEEAAKYLLTVKKSEETKLTKVTRAEWDLDYDVYYYGIDSATVTVDGNSMDLIEAISRDKLSFDQLLEDAQAQGDRIYHTMYSDGGSKLYRYKDYAILKMNTIDGDRTLYIGTPDLTPNVI